MVVEVQVARNKQHILLIILFCVESILETIYNNYDMKGQNYYIKILHYEKSQNSHKS